MPTATPKPIAVKGAWVAMTANQMIWPIAVEAGYFKKYGIDLDLSYINGSSTAVPALINGDIGITTVAGSAVVSAQAGGQDLVMIAGFLNKAVWKVMAGPGITSIDQVRGKTIAVTRIGNADYFAWQTIAARQGWKSDELKFVSANDVPGQITFLKTGNAQVWPRRRPGPRRSSTRASTTNPSSRWAWSRCGSGSARTVPPRSARSRRASRRWRGGRRIRRS